MKKNKTYWFLASFIFLFLFSCNKNTSFVVYGPPFQGITFSNVTDLIIDSTGKTINLKAQVDSKESLQKIEVLYQPWNVSTTISSFPNPNSYSLNVPVTIPANAELKIHSIVIKAINVKGDSTMTEVKVGLKDLDYPKLYMADITDAASMNSNLFGEPIVMDKIGSHSYQLIYYARTANIKVRFLPNKTTFSPVAVGLDPNNSNNLITNSSMSLPIQLGAKGYYKITVSTLLLNYTVQQFTPSGTPYDQVALVGRGFYDYPNMNWQNTLPDIILLDKDSSNPYLFTKQIRLGTPPGQTYTSTQFILTTNNGWTNFWRFDNGTSPELAVFNGGTNTDIPITSSPSTYLFVFDSYTGRVQALKQ